MEEGFEDAEIGVAQIRPLDALLRVGGERLEGFHENEPDMNAGGVLPLRGLSPHGKLSIDEKYIDVNIL
jgi:hypothetical protein